MRGWARAAWGSAGEGREAAGRAGAELAMGAGERAVRGWEALATVEGEWGAVMGLEGSARGAGERAVRGWEALATVEGEWGEVMGLEGSARGAGERPMQGWAAEEEWLARGPVPAMTQEGSGRITVNSSRQHCEAASDGVCSEGRSAHLKCGG